MKQEEKLFAAFSGIDEALLDRCTSARSRRSPLVWLAAAAACAAALALAFCLLPGGPQGPEASVTPPPTAPASPAVTDPPATPDITEPPLVTDPPVPSLPTSEEQFHLLQLSAAESDTDFILYMNPTLYRGGEENGIYVIRPVTPLGELPDCRMEIAHCAADVDQTALDLFEKMSVGWTVSLPEESFSLDNLRICANKGLSWDSECCDVYIVDDGQGGCFTLSAFYFMEATEGHGVRFADMAATFEVLSPDSGQPQWLTRLKDAVSRLTPALFSGSSAGVEDLLSPEALLWGYEEDVTPYLSIASVDYTVDDSQSPTEAIVSIKHRLGGEDSYTFLTMSLHYDGQWYLDWEGLEK